MSKRRWTILLGAIILGGGLLGLVLGREPVEEGWCSLKPKAVGNPTTNALAILAWQVLEPGLSRPNDISDLPSGFNQACYYRMRTGDTGLALAIDLSSTEKLSFDADHDGRLSDEQCFPPRSVELRSNVKRRRYGPIRLRCGPSDADGAVVFYAISPPVSQPALLSLYPAFYRTGKLRIDGRVHKVAVMDGDYDGRFGSLISLPASARLRLPGSDVFAIDINRNGKFEASLYTRSNEVMPLSRMVRLGESYYAVDVSADGSRLALTKTQPAFGRLAIEPPDARVQLKLWSDAADQFLSCDAGTWDLPAGTYQAIDPVLSLPDPNRGLWVFRAIDAGKLSLFTIRPNETTRFRIGPPFTVTAGVRKNADGTVSISPVITGCAGEQYQADFERNGRRAPEREFKIVDEEGTVLIADNFEYG